MPRHYSIPTLLTFAEASEALGLSHMTLRRWAADGWLATIKIGGTIRILEEDLINLLARHRREAAPKISVTEPKRGRGRPRKDGQPPQQRAA